MTRVSWWLVNVLSQTLEPGERDAVCGDIAESGESGGQALRDLLGLVVRRQAGLWKDWRPWLALVIVPFGMWLSLRSVSLGRSYDLNLWIIGNYRAIDPVILRDTGLSVLNGVASLVFRSLLLVGSAWSIGFVLGSLSRRTIPINGTLFCLTLLVGEFVGIPKHHFYVNGAVYSLTLYSVLLPLILLSVLVLLPSLWGMQQGARPSTPPILRTLSWLAAALTFGAAVPAIGFVVLVAAAIWRRGRGETPQFN